GRLRAGQVAADAEDVAALSQSEAGCSRGLVCEVSLHGLIEFGEGRLERALRAHDLPTVHRALAGERHQSRLFGAPGGECGGPAGRAVEVGDLLAALDHRAVDVAGEDR